GSDRRPGGRGRHRPARGARRRRRRGGSPARPQPHRDALLRPGDRTPAAAEEGRALMLAAITRGTFSALAGSPLLKKAASRYGMRQPDSFARRFVAGQRAEDAIAAVQAIERLQMSATIDLLGESVTS